MQLRWNMEQAVSTLITWYRENKRSLPWRIEPSPYHVWISEIMLQQTRIEAVISYYFRFIEQLPTVFDLARVDEDKLLKLWEGLGYYNRARNLKKAAQIIVEQYHGEFPSTYSAILALPGIGEYTASAIVSICFSEPQVTIDGNVLRVYMRVYDCYENIDLLATRKRVRQHLMTMIPKQAGEFNQALMELGEVICIPRGVPKCHICPLHDVCLGRKRHTFLSLPVRSPKKEKQVENYTVLLIKNRDKYAICQRDDTGLLANMWQFPMLPDDYSQEEVRGYLNDCGYAVSSLRMAISYTHIFTHKKWKMTSYKVEIDSDTTVFEQGKEKCCWASLEELISKYAIPSAFLPFLNFLIDSDETDHRLERKVEENIKMKSVD